jgi:predicted small secreted protein
MADFLNKRSLMLIGMVALTAPFLQACNTVEGAGEDIQSVGGAVENTADEVGDEIGEAAD